MRRRRIITVLSLALPLVLLAPSPALADGPWVRDEDRPIYTWRDADSLPGVTYRETSGAGFFYRKGIAAFMAEGTGYTWQTTVWLGTISTSGTNEARLKDSQLGFLRTKAKYVYLPNPNADDPLRFIAWICNVVSATRVAPASPQGLAVDVEATPSDAVIPGFGPIGDNVPDALISTFRHLGRFDGYDAWRVTDAARTVHLLVSDGRYLAETSSTAEEFASLGIPIRIDKPTGAVQLVLLPSDQLDTSGLVASGFSAVSPELYATADPADGYSVVQVPSTAAVPDTAAGGTAGVIVPLFVPPTP